MTEKKDRLGPFDVTIAANAPIAEGSFQPVLISHGNSGRMRNHHLTAKALAEAGFIVVAPLHTVDHLIGTFKTFKALNWRSIELAYALEAVLQENDFRNSIDLSYVHSLGYSLGAVTVLNAAGAGVDGALVEDHCRRNDDPEFCELPGFFLRWKLRWVRDVDPPPPLIRTISDVYFPLAFVNGGVAVIAPVGQGVVISDRMFRARKVFIVGLEGDTTTLPRFHAQRLATIIPDAFLYDYSLRAGHHAAFIAPFAKRVTDIEHIPAAKDPPGFDRMAFLHQLNEDLVRFYLEHSRPPVGREG